MNKLKIFDNEYYNTFMFVSMLIIIMLIFFNLSNILEQGISKQDMKIENKLTGFAVDEGEIEDEKKEDGEIEDEKKEDGEIEDEKKELYTEKSYLMYYMLLGFLGLCIFILSLIFFLPKLKDIT